MNITVHFEFALVLIEGNTKTSVSVLYADENSKAHDIPLTSTPTPNFISTIFTQSVEINPMINKLYVANGNEPGTVSIVDYDTDRDYGGVSYSTVDVLVGDVPHDIAVDPNTNAVYVSTLDSISVIDGLTDEVTTTISVDSTPFDLVVNPNNNKIYVANSDDATISVIDSVKNKVVKVLTTGGSPRDLAVNPNTNMVYVTNPYLNTISVINSSTDNIVVTNNFRINPPEGGHISCGGKQITDKGYITQDIDMSLECTAKPNNGFKFNSWSGVLAYAESSNPIAFNSTQYGTSAANFDVIPLTSEIEMPQEFYEIISALIAIVV